MTGERQVLSIFNSGREHPALPRTAAVPTAARRWQRVAAVPPHPGPLPWGGGEPSPVLLEFADADIAGRWTRRAARERILSDAPLSPLPAGEGEGEGEPDGREYREDGGVLPTGDSCSFVSIRVISEENALWRASALTTTYCGLSAWDYFLRSDLVGFGRIPADFGT